VAVTRVFVTGSAGQLGSAISAEFADVEVIAHTRASLDVTDADAVRRAVAAAAPSVVINCSAFNDVDAAEDHAVEAFAVNAMAVRSLARAAEDNAAAFVHFGTDFVFDGKTEMPYREEHPPSPRSAYAMSKLVGEWFALDTPRAYVLRVESLFGTLAGWQGRRGSMDGIVAGLEGGRTVRVFVDRVVSPSYVVDVAAATRHLVEKGAAPGLYHCVNTGHASWHEVAAEAARLLGVPARLEAVTLDDVQLRAPRPRFCALSNRKLSAAGFPMPDWRDALARWISSRGCPAAIE
jgi:dTDP-4-dehydrorhamnose reductase